MPEGLDEESIKTVFGQYGSIISIRITSKPGMNFTSCLARFASLEEASGVVQGLNGQIPNGLSQPVTVRYANNPAGAGGGVPASQAAQVAHQVAVQLAQGQGSARYQPYASGAAQNGGAKGAGKGAQAGHGMNDIIEAMWDSGAMPGGDGRTRESHVEMFIFGLPPDCTDLHLYQMMSPFGQIGARGVMVKTNPQDGSCMGYGFVNFLAEESADMAISTLNGASLPNGKSLRVERKKQKGQTTGI